MSHSTTARAGDRTPNARNITQVPHRWHGRSENAKPPTNQFGYDERDWDTTNARQAKPTIDNIGKDERPASRTNHRQRRESPPQADDG